MAFRQLSEGGLPFLKLGLYGGLTLEHSILRSDLPSLEDMGTVTSGSVFLGFDTPVIPTYLSFGYNDNKEGIIYLNLGRLTRSR